MREEHIQYYVTKAFHEWFFNISQHMGDAPFQAVVQNFLYYNDAREPSKSRVEVFVKGLLELIERLKAVKDDNIRIKSLEIKGVYVNDWKGYNENLAATPGINGECTPGN